MDPKETREAGEVEEELPPMEEVTLRRIERNILDYRFQNKRFLEEALTHTSFYFPSKRPGPSYERLEFIGDSILGLLMAKQLFSSYANLAPYQLTLLKDANLDTERLSRIAITSGLHQYLRHKLPQFDFQVEEFMEGMKEYPIHSYGLLDPPKQLADMVESVKGAVLIDSDDSIDTVSKVFKRLAEPFINPNTLGKYLVTELQELCQKNRMKHSVVSTWEDDGTVKFYVDGVLFGSASCSHKKEIAQNRAAKAALDKLKKALS